MFFKIKITKARKGTKKKKKKKREGNKRSTPRRKSQEKANRPVVVLSSRHMLPSFAVVAAAVGAGIAAVEQDRGTMGAVMHHLH